MGFGSGGDVRRRILLVVVVLGLLLPALPALAGDVTYEEVEAARQALREVANELEDRVAAYDRAVIEESLLRDRLDDMSVAVSSRERELVVARRSARDRAAAMYMTAGSQLGNALVTGADLSSAPARYIYLATVSQTDRDVVNRLEATRRDYEQQKEILDQAIADQAGLRQQMDDLLDDIYAELDAADADYQALKARWEEQERERVAREIFLATSTTTTRPPVTSTSPGSPPTTQAPTTTAGGGVTTTTTAPPPPPPVPAGTMVCPVDGAVTFRDSWGEPRSGGRGHQGVDMMASTGTPLVAIESGYIYRISSHSLGGLGIYVHGATGLWYYAHNSAFAEGISEGDSVVAGQRIAYVGYSGNASPNWPHVHFAWIPNLDWVYKNPYPIVNDLCR